MIAGRGISRPFLRAWWPPCSRGHVPSKYTARASQFQFRVFDSLGGRGYGTACTQRRLRDGLHAKALIAQPRQRGYYNKPLVSNGVNKGLSQGLLRVCY